MQRCLPFRIDFTLIHEIRYTSLKGDVKSMIRLHVDITENCHITSQLMVSDMTKLSNTAMQCFAIEFEFLVFRKYFTGTSLPLHTTFICRKNTWNWNPPDNTIQLLLKCGGCKSNRFKSDQFD